jgi:hypothetical protein
VPSLKDDQWKRHLSGKHSVFWLLRDNLLKVFDAVFGEGHRFVIAGVIDVSAISGNRIGASF